MLVLIWISSSHWFHNLWVTVLLKVNFSWESSQASLTVTPFFECWEPSQVLLNFKHDIDRSESRGCSLGPFLATKPPNSGTTATILLMFDPQLYPCVRKKRTTKQNLNNADRSSSVFPGEQVRLKSRPALLPDDTSHTATWHRRRSTGGSRGSYYIQPCRDRSEAN
jgi:hypothetical protein